jgi:predicted anti-sigma-YlaC factor YlaD
VDAALDSDCRAARELVSLSLDCELSALERRRLDRHLRDCAPCRLYGARVKAITYALRSAPLELSSVFLPATP